MAEESGIDEKVAGKEGVKGTVAEETPEALREQIKKLKGDVKVFSYISVIAPIAAMIFMAAIFIYKEGEDRPTKIYSVSKVHNSVGDLDHNGVPDLVLEEKGGYRTPLFGYNFGVGVITYVKSDEMEKLNPNSTTDYECIDNKIARDSPITWVSDVQKKRIDEDRKALEEQGFNQIIVDNTCFQGSSHHK